MGSHLKTPTRKQHEMEDKDREHMNTKVSVAYTIKKVFIDVQITSLTRYTYRFLIYRLPL